MDRRFVIEKLCHYEPELKAAGVLHIRVFGDSLPEVRYQTARSPHELAGMATQQRSAATTASPTSIGGEMPKVFHHVQHFPLRIGIYVSIECVRLRLKKILKGRALSCNRTRSADALSDRSWSALLCEVAMNGCEAPLAAPFRLRTARYVLGPQYLHHTLVRHRSPRPRAGGRRDRTRRIPLGGNLVRIVRTFEPFPDPIRPWAFRGQTGVELLMELRTLDLPDLPSSENMASCVAAT